MQGELDRSVTRGTEIVFNSFSRPLFYYRVCHFLISSSFSLTSRLRIEPIYSALHVSTHINGVVELCDACKQYAQTLMSSDFVFDLTILDLIEPNIIITMNWLTNVHTACLFKT